MSESVRRSPFEWRQVRVLVLGIGGALLLLYCVYRIGKVLDVFAKRYEVVTLIPSALGLREGAPVTLAGQQIGQVKKIDFIPVQSKRGENNLRVVLAISHNVKDQIRRDSHAYLRTQGLLGDKFVDIEPGTPGSAILQEGDTLPTGKSVDMDQFLTQASEMLDQSTTIVKDVRDLANGLARGEGTLGQFMKDDRLYISMVGATGELQKTLAAVNQPNGTFGRMMRDPALYNRLESATARFDSLGSMILYGNGSMSRLLRSDDLYKNLARTSTRADSAMANIAAMVDKMTTGQGTIQKMMTDPALYDAFLKSMVDLQTLINDVRQTPGKYKPNIDVHVFGGGAKKDTTNNN